MRFGRFSMLALALAAGAVDALSFLALGQVFTANMTGNVVLLGLALGTGDTSHVIRSGIALATFCLGLAAGFTLLGRAPPAGRDPPAGVPVSPLAVLLAELALLVLVAAGWAAHVLPRPALIAASGTAMGLQSAVTRWAGGPGLSTTYLTGTLTSLAGRAVGPRSGVLRPLAVVLSVASGAVIAASALRLHAAVTPLIAPATVAAATAAWVLTADRRGRPRPPG
ncbi:DUF1275 family protein [Nonomuraea sp. NPDC052265]|uniref:DUF1275 family protein n=1 Tax=Nonomuraea sp. NPDC052265 TaxID=3364374 RepID=UPI0037C4F5E1